MPVCMARPGSAMIETGRSIEATELECLWECRDDCEPAALPGGLCVAGARWVSFPGLSLCRRRPKNLPAEDCLPLLSCDVLEGIVCYALRRLQRTQHGAAGRPTPEWAFVVVEFSAEEGWAQGAIARAVGQRYKYPETQQCPAQRGRRRGESGVSCERAGVVVWSSRWPMRVEAPESRDVAERWMAVRGPRGPARAFTAVYNRTRPATSGQGGLKHKLRCAADGVFRGPGEMCLSLRCNVVLFHIETSPETRSGRRRARVWRGVRERPRTAPALARRPRAPSRARQRLFAPHLLGPRACACACALACPPTSCERCISAPRRPSSPCSSACIARSSPCSGRLATTHPRDSRPWASSPLCPLSSL
jgi:hypothetical protein